MGTGVGEAMLISAASGAAMGGGSALLTGGDPLRGALLGGLTGGALGGVGGALGGAGGTAGGAAGAAGANAAPNLANVAAQPGLNVANAGNIGAALPAGATMNPALAMPPPVAPTPPPQVGLKEMFLGGKGLEDMSFGDRFGQFAAQNPGQLGMMGGTLSSMMFPPRRKIPEEEEYDGPLSKFRYDPLTYRPSFASGGIASIPRPGGKVSGPGDGMSDHVPASINNAHPANLSDGEFVIPADVVSGLGNGSTDAGARQLYQLMDRVRMARTGSTRQGPTINPEEHMHFAKGGSVGFDPAKYGQAPAQIPAEGYVQPVPVGDTGRGGSLADFADWRREQEIAANGRPTFGYTSFDGSQESATMYDTPEFQNRMWDMMEQYSALKGDGAPAYDNSADDAAMQAQIQEQRAQLAQLPGYTDAHEYSKMARPGYKDFGPNGQFYQPIYQPQFQPLPTPNLYPAGAPADIFYNEGVNRGIWG